MCACATHYPSCSDRFKAAEFKMWFHQSHVQRDSHFPSPAGLSWLPGNTAGLRLICCWPASPGPVLLAAFLGTLLWACTAASSITLLPAVLTTRCGLSLACMCWFLYGYESFDLWEITSDWDENWTPRLRLSWSLDTYLCFPELFIGNPDLWRKICADLSQVHVSSYCLQYCKI